jgi:transcriptional regulator with XRE-family HTH domain
VSKGEQPSRKGEVFIKPATAAAFRMKCGLSQAGLAAKATLELREATGDPDASISESLVALIETGRRQPSLRNARALAAAMGISVDALAVTVKVIEAVA